MLRRGQITVLSNGNDMGEWANREMAIRDSCSPTSCCSSHLLLPSELSRKALGSGASLFFDALPWLQLCALDALRATVFRTVPHKVRLKSRSVWMSGSCAPIDRNANGLQQRGCAPNNLHTFGLKLRGQCSAQSAHNLSSVGALANRLLTSLTL